MHRGGKEQQITEQRSAETHIFNSSVIWKERDSSAGVEVKRSMQLKRKNIKKGKTRRCIGFLFVHKQVFEEENKRAHGFVFQSGT